MSAYSQKCICLHVCVIFRSQWWPQLRNSIKTRMKERGTTVIKTTGLCFISLRRCSREVGHVLGTFGGAACYDFFFFSKHGVDGCTRIYTITFKRPTVFHFFFLSLLHSRFKKKKKIITCLIITRLLVFNQNMPVQKLFILHSHLWLHCRAGRGGHSSNPAANSLSTPNKDKQIAITSLWFLLCICTALY